MEKNKYIGTIMEEIVAWRPPKDPFICVISACEAEFKMNKTEKPCKDQKSFLNFKLSKICNLHI